MLDNCILRGNTAEDVGGAINAVAAGLQLRKCRFEDNRAGVRGGAIDHVSGTLEMDECTLVNNVAGHRGGGLAVLDVYSSWIDGCTLVGNEALEGAAFALGAVFDQLRLSASILAGHRGGAAITWDGSGNLPADNVDMWDNEGGGWVGNLADQLGQDFNIAADPLFCGPTADPDGLTLATGSPCLPDNNPGGVLMGAHDWGCDQPIGAPVPAAALDLAAHPNPFNPAVVLSYRLEAAAVVRLEVYDLSGHRLATLVNGRQDGGDHQATWNGLDSSGRALPSGVYLAGLRAGTLRSHQKLVLVR